MALFRATPANFLRFQTYFHRPTKELGQIEVPLMFLTFQAKTVFLPSFEFHYAKEQSGGQKFWMNLSIDPFLNLSKV